MTTQKIIDRLQQQNWFIKFNNEHEEKLIITACIGAWIPIVKWRSWTNSFYVDVNFNLSNNSNFISCDDINGLATYGQPSFFPKNKYQDITEWFFDEINRQDGV